MVFQQPASACALDWRRLSGYHSSLGNPLEQRFRRTKMRRFVVLMSFASNTILFAAGSADLLSAIRKGVYAQLRKLLESGADVNTSDKDGTTAWMHTLVESDVRI